MNDKNSDCPRLAEWVGSSIGKFFIIYEKDAKMRWKKV